MEPNQRSGRQTLPYAGEYDVSYYFLTRRINGRDREGFRGAADYYSMAINHSGGPPSLRSTLINSIPAGMHWAGSRSKLAKRHVSNFLTSLKVTSTPMLFAGATLIPTTPTSFTTRGSCPGSGASVVAEIVVAENRGGRDGR